MKVRLKWAYLGLMPYRQALELQYHQAARAAAFDSPFLFLLQHPPVVTLGRNANPANLKLSKEEFREKNVPVVNVKRGGDVTCHCPGQLVGYPVASLRSIRYSVPYWVKGHVTAIISFLQEFGIMGQWSDTHPGIWIDNKKIASFGFHISKGVSTHGFSLNINPDLSWFDTIVPCGLSHHGVTSMAELGVKVQAMELAAQILASKVAEVFNFDHDYTQSLWQENSNLCIQASAYETAQ